MDALVWHKVEAGRYTAEGPDGTYEIFRADKWWINRPGQVQAAYGDTLAEAKSTARTMAFNLTDHILWS